MNRSIRLKALCLVIPVLAGSSLAWGQAATVVYPQDNVRGGAIAARRPGLRVSASIAAHSERMDTVLRQHGGAVPQQSTGNERHVLIVSTILEGLFSVLQQLADALALAATVGTLPTTATPG